MCPALETGLFLSGNRHLNCELLFPRECDTFPYGRAEGLGRVRLLRSSHLMLPAHLQLHREPCFRRRWLMNMRVLTLFNFLSRPRSVHTRGSLEGGKHMTDSCRGPSVAPGLQAALSPRRLTDSPHVRAVAIFLYGQGNAGFEGSSPSHTASHCKRGDACIGLAAWRRVASALRCSPGCSKGVALLFYTEA